MCMSRELQNICLIVEIIEIGQSASYEKGTEISKDR